MAIQQTELVDQVLKQAADRNASDIHLVAGQPVIYRIHGTLTRDTGEALTAAQIQELALAAVGQETLAEVLRSGGTVTSCSVPGVIDGRMAITRNAGAYSVTIRIVPKAILSVSAMGVPPELVAAVEARRGIVVVAGPVGSGKSTSAISLVDHLNATQPVHIVTIEDPICGGLISKQGLVEQREVGIDVPDTLTGLRCTLVQDADVVYVSELHSIAELEAVVSLAEMGHMVIFSSHATSPENVIRRLLDAVPADRVSSFARRLGEQLRAISVQILLPKATGRGRVAAYGLLIPSDATRQALAEGTDVAIAAPGPGSLKLADHVAQLCREGKVSQQAAADALAAL